MAGFAVHPPQYCCEGRAAIWLGGQTPPIPIVRRVRVKHQASGVVGHQYKPAPRNFCTIDIAQFEEFAPRTGRIQFVPDELWWFCFLCRVRALFHVRYPFALFGYKCYANRSQQTVTRCRLTIQLTDRRCQPGLGTGDQRSHYCQCLEPARLAAVRVERLVRPLLIAC